MFVEEGGAQAMLDSDLISDLQLPNLPRSLYLSEDLSWPSMVRFTVPEVDLSSLCHKWCATWCDLGAYEHLSKQQAPDATALAEFSGWLSEMATVAPTLEVSGIREFKSGFLKAVARDPSLNKTQLRGDLWAKQRSDRLLTVLYHMRKLKRDEHALFNLAGTCTGDVLKKITQVLDKMTTVTADDFDRTLKKQHSSMSLASTSVKSEAKSDVKSEVKTKEKDGVAEDDKTVKYEEEDSQSAAEAPSADKAPPADKKPSASADKAPPAEKSPLYSKLFPPKPQHVTPKKKKTTVKSTDSTKKSPMKTMPAAEEGEAYYGRECYKHARRVGFKRKIKGRKEAKQIGSISCSFLSEEQLKDFGQKVLNTLNKLDKKGDPTEEESVFILAKHKLKLMQTMDH